MQAFWPHPPMLLPTQVPRIPLFLSGERSGFGEGVTENQESCQNCLWAMLFSLGSGLDGYKIAATFLRQIASLLFSGKFWFARHSLCPGNDGAC